MTFVTIFARNDSQKIILTFVLNFIILINCVGYAPPLIHANHVTLMEEGIERMKKTVGTHLIIDAWQASPALLNDPEWIRETLIQAVEAGGATLIDLCVHQFSPHGVTATATLAESHIAIHTWPEYGYFAADCFFCGEGDPVKAMKMICKALQAKEIRTREIKRGFEPKIEQREFMPQIIEGT